MPAVQSACLPAIVGRPPVTFRRAFLLGGWLGNWTLPWARLPSVGLWGFCTLAVGEGSSDPLAVDEERSDILAVLFEVHRIKKDMDT